MTTRILTGFQPTGFLQLGNYLGAIRPLLDLAADPANDVTVFVADLHALTVEHDPGQLRSRTLELAGTLLACGLDARSTLFVQSGVPAHTELSYLLESTAVVGEMTRMTQFKEKAGEQGTARLSLLTYPALMAADILAHGAELVPVGEDQRQHLELTRTLARRFNARYGPVFTVPCGFSMTPAARVKDLRRPTAKMGKSGADGAGTIFLRDDPDTVAAKVRRAVTDTEPSLELDAERRPGVTNLAAVLGALRRTTPQEAVAALSGAAELKQAVTDAVIETLVPIQRRHAELAADPATLHTALRAGQDVATTRAAATVTAARTAIGLLPALPGIMHSVPLNGGRDGSA